MTTRRDFLTSAGAVALASTLPSVPVTVVPAAVAPPSTPMLAWSFDIKHGDYRDTVIAATKEEAHAKMIAEHFDDLADNCPRLTLGNHDECTCEDCGCTENGMSSVEREPRLDKAAARGQITMDDYRSAGWGMVCDRCGGEPHGGDWEVVDSVAVCNDCMTIDEWRVVNPEYAAELVEDARIDAMSDDEYNREFGENA